MNRQSISEAFNSLAELEKKQRLAKRPVKKKINESVKEIQIPEPYDKYYEIDNDFEGIDVEEDEIIEIGDRIPNYQEMTLVAGLVSKQEFEDVLDSDYPCLVFNDIKKEYDVVDVYYAPPMGITCNYTSLPDEEDDEDELNESKKSLNESSLYDRAMKWFKTHGARSDMEEACGKKRVNEDFERDLESKILEMCEEGVLDWEAVARELLREASEDDLEYFCRAFDIDFDLESEESNSLKATSGENLIAMADKFFETNGIDEKLEKEVSVFKPRYEKEDSLLKIGDAYFNSPEVKKKLKAQEEKEERRRQEKKRQRQEKNESLENGRLDSRESKILDLVFVYLSGFMSDQEFARLCLNRFEMTEEELKNFCGLDKDGNEI